MNLKERAWRLINSRHMLWGLGVASFFEAILIPIPLEAVLIPAMQANRRRIWALATAALAGCVLGAVVGYGVGHFLFEAVGQNLIDWFSSPEQYEQIREQMNRRGFWFVISIGVTPVPFQIAMLAAGATSYSIPLFLLATGLARAFRYYGLALLVWKFGDRAEELFKQHKLRSAIVISLVVVLLWWLSSQIAGA